jgi:hypothetical protein
MADLELLEETSAASSEKKFIVLKIHDNEFGVSHFLVAFQEAQTSRQQGLLAFWRPPFQTSSFWQQKYWPGAACWLNGPSRNPRF